MNNKISFRIIYQHIEKNIIILRPPVYVSINWFQQKNL